MEKQIIPCIIGVITNEKGQVYLQKRHDPGRDAHGFWEFPGGGKEVGETPEQALIREVKEETGYNIEIIRLLPRIYMNVWPEAEVLVIAYECRIIGGENKTQDLEVSESAWIDPESFDYSVALQNTKEIIKLLEA